MRKFLGICLLAFLLVTSCVKPPDYPVEPIIEFVSFSKTSIGQNVDTTLLTIYFTDGDGDLGEQDNSPTTNIILTDTRIGQGFKEYYKVPFIPKQGVGNGISGEIYISLTQCCVPTTGVPCQPNPGQMPEDIVYTMQLSDRAGNLSNIITLPPLTIICD